MLMKSILCHTVTLAFLGAVCIPRAADAQSTWRDPSPHEQRFVTVESNVRVEVLDWGGSGRPLVLLTQLGQTSHIYDDWAASLARDFRVLGITRRGFGASTGATDDYSTERLARDVLAVIEAEHLTKPILVGHGVAGEELSWIGVNDADRVAGLVYLDAAYDRSNVGAEAAIARRIPTGPPAPQDMSSVESVAAWMSKGVGGPIPQAEVRQLAEVAPDGRVVGQRTSPGSGNAVMAQFKRVDPSGIRVPVLALYATRRSAAVLPGCQAPKEPSVVDACNELFAWMTAQLDRSKQLFGGIPRPVRIMDLPGANSFMFLSNGPEVTSAVKAFASELPR
jgi:non-heme chloroperoxidase